MGVRSESRRTRFSTQLDPLTQQLLDSVATGNEFSAATVRPIAPNPTNRISGDSLQRILTSQLEAIHYSGVRLSGLFIDGDVDLSFMDWKGQLSLRNCRIEGKFILKCAEIVGDVDLTGSYVKRLNIQATKIDGDLILRNGFHAANGIYGKGVSINGSFDMRDSSVCGPKTNAVQMALELYRARIGDMFLQNTIIRGGMYAPRLTVDRNIRFQGSVISSRRSIGWAHDGVDLKGAIVLYGATVAGTMYFSTLRSRSFLAVAVTESEPAINLEHAKCSQLRIHAEVMAANNFLLEGFTYDDLKDLALADLLAVLDSNTSVLPSAYSQLAIYAKTIGDVDSRRRILQSLERKVTENMRQRSRMRLLRSLYGAFVGYGYAAHRAIGWLLVIVAAGVVLLHAGPAVYARKPFANAIADTAQQLSWSDSAGVTIDGFLPFAGLNTKDLWFAAPTSASGWIALGAVVGLRFTAWGLAALAVLSINNVVRNHRS